MTRITVDMATRLERLKGERTDYDEWREEFPAKVKALRAQQKEWHMQRMEDTMLGLYEDGVSVRQIAEAYGTQERRTVDRMVQRASNRKTTPLSVDREAQHWQEILSNPPSED